MVRDLSGHTQSWRVFTAPFNARTITGEHIEANYVPQYEWLDEPFEIADGGHLQLNLSTDTQYDSESDIVGISTRLRWTIQPGNDLFLVWAPSVMWPLET
jgi:hypothetical protein